MPNDHCLNPVPGADLTFPIPSPGVCLAASPGFDFEIDALIAKRKYNSYFRETQLCTKSVQRRKNCGSRERPGSIPFTQIHGSPISSIAWESCRCSWHTRDRGIAYACAKQIPGFVVFAIRQLERRSRTRTRLPRAEPVRVIRAINGHRSRRMLKRAREFPMEVRGTIKPLHPGVPPSPERR